MSGEACFRTGPRIVGGIYRRRDDYTIQFCCSDPTFQSSALVWVGWGVVNPGGVNFESTSWICLPPPLITNAICITPWGKGVLGTFKLITALPVQSELTV